LSKNFNKIALLFFELLKKLEELFTTTIKNIITANLYFAA